jgi:Kef-type K+ transport system membrane component KefB
MHQDPVIFTLFLIFSGAAIIATLALYARLALLVAYILLGVIIGPFATGLVTDTDLIGQMAHVGIIFLLFLMGLELNPRDLLLMLRKTLLVTLGSTLAFFSLGYLVAILFGFGQWEAMLIGAATTFSSTIIGLKLLPTTVLHHQRSGEIIISILLLQDFIAIFLLLVIQGGGQQENPVVEVLKLAVALPLLVMAAAFIVQHVLLKLLMKFDTFKEYIFLLSIGWCLGLAEAAAAVGLSQEIGAFIAGISLAASPISLYMAESLKPLRDFFLILFFVALGAGFDLSMLPEVLLPALLLAGVMLAAKPLVFSFLLQKTGESKKRSSEIGARLGQMSEFSLLVVVLALEHQAISERGAYLVQLATLLTFFASTYLVVLRYPTPIALSEHLRKD